MYLHIFIRGEEKWIVPFVNFLETALPEHPNYYCIVGRPKHINGLKHTNRLEYFYGISEYKRLIKMIVACDKLILHGLWVGFICDLINARPEIGKKTYWLPWGGDFYYPEKQEEKKHNAIPKIRNLIGINNTDVKYINETYNAYPTTHECLGYTNSINRSDLYGLRKIKKGERLRILVGNSAYKTSEHEECLQLLQKYSRKITIFTPLSYGPRENAKTVINMGRSIFGDEYKPLIEFFSAKKYHKFLAAMDIAVFLHKRQQAFNNAALLLSMGKTIYFRPNSPNWEIFTELGFRCKSNLNHNLSLLTEEERSHNVSLSSRIFNEENLKLQWNNILKS